MSPFWYFLSVCTIALTLHHAALCSATMTNIEVKRIVDVSSSIAVSRTTVVMRNEAPTPAEYFFIAIKNDGTEHVGDFWISSPKRPEKALRKEGAHEVPDMQKDSTGYKVFFDSPLASGDETSVDIRMDIPSAIRPVPETITGTESQYMKYFGSSYFYSPYESRSVQTTLILGSTIISSKEGIIEPSAMNGKRYKLGPYANVKPFSFEPLSIRFKHDQGFLAAKHMMKQFYVSHWGTIATKEEYVIHNAAASHEGEWSRADHTRAGSKFGTAVVDMWANLPADATRVEYKDLVGNITSSRLRKPTKSKRPVQLFFRFPLMGGWKNHFWVTYDVPLSSYAISRGSEHVLKLPIFPSANMDMFCEQLEIRVLLPEGSHSVEVNPHSSLEFETANTVQRTTLTVIGRPVLTLKLKAIRSQSKHSPTVVIKYQYNPLLMWGVPIVVSAAILAIFTLCILCIRNGLSMVDDDIGDSESKLKTS